MYKSYILLVYIGHTQVICRKCQEMCILKFLFMLPMYPGYRKGIPVMSCVLAAGNVPLMSRMLATGNVPQILLYTVPGNVKEMSKYPSAGNVHT